MTLVPNERTSLLDDLIRSRLRANSNWMSFESFMQLALHEPGLGYYAGGPSPLGKQGDFVSAPELGSLFASCLARFVDKAMPEHGSVLELGGGSGRLLQDLSAGLEKLGNPATEYLLLETSAELAAAQEQMLEPVQNFRHITSIPDDFRGVIIANEVLDALPCRVLAKRRDGWIQRGICLDPNGSLSWTDGPQAEKDDVQYLASFDLAVGYQTEINRRAEALAATLASSLESGIILLIDYGFTASEYYHQQRTGGTLVAHRNHTVGEDVLSEPGKCDLTAHIDFSAIAAAAASANAELLGFATQSAFLADCGIADGLAEMNKDASDWQSAQQLSAQVQTLIMPQEMGELFKVLALSKNHHCIPPGFACQDLSDRL